MDFLTHGPFCSIKYPADATVLFVTLKRQPILDLVVTVVWLLMKYKESHELQK